MERMFWKSSKAGAGGGLGVSCSSLVLGPKILGSLLVLQCQGLGWFLVSPLLVLAAVKGWGCSVFGNFCLLEWIFSPKSLHSGVTGRGEGQLCPCHPSGWAKGQSPLSARAGQGMAEAFQGCWGSPARLTPVLWVTQIPLWALSWLVWIRERMLGQGSPHLQGQGIPFSSLAPQSSGWEGGAAAQMHYSGFPRFFPPLSHKIPLLP